MKMVPLGEVAYINPPAQKLESTTTIDFVGMAELSEGLAAATPRASAKFGDYAKGYTQFKKGDILAAKITPCWENGKVGIANLNNEFGMGSTEFHVIRPSGALDERYLLHFLRQEHVRSTGTLRMAGSGGQRRVPKKYLTDVKVPLPPLDEQRRIAAILDKADAIRKKRRQAIAHLDSLTQSIFREMFASVQDTETVANLAAKSKRSIRTGPFGSQLLHEEFTSEGVPVLGIDNVVENKFMWKKERYIGESKFQQLEKYEVFPGDVLITIMGTTGRCAVVPIGIPRSINTKHICAITPDTEKVLPEFLQAAFLYHPATQRFLKDNTRGAIMAGLNMGIIKKTPLPVASLSDQKTFVERSQRIDTFRTRLINGHNSDLFAALQSRAFRGEL